MGMYHNPPAEVPQIGRQLDFHAGDASFARMQRQVRADETIVGFADRGLFHLAPVVQDQSDVDEFYEQYRRGLLLSLRFYAVPSERLSTGVTKGA